MGKVKGSYILLAELATESNISVGKLGHISFPKAWYAYVGSAMNGLRARLARHLRREKKFHWHIDYLVREAEVKEITLCPSEKRVECSLARVLAGRFQSIPGFGSSDCKCRSHLYFSRDRDRLKAGIAEAVKQAGLAHETVHRRS